MLSGHSSYYHQGIYMLRNSALKQTEIREREVKIDLPNNLSKTNKNVFTLCTKMSAHHRLVSSMGVTGAILEVERLPILPYPGKAGKDTLNWIVEK